jgi:excisionase family DNA binding protein
MRTRQRIRQQALQQAPLPRLAYRVGEAASVLGVSEDHFGRYIAPQLRWIRSGACKLVSRDELRAWLEANSARTLKDEAA